MWAFQPIFYSYALCVGSRKYDNWAQFGSEEITWLSDDDTYSATGNEHK